MNSLLQKALKQKALILSDGKPGHLNQSIAFCKLLGIDYEVHNVRPRGRFCKAFSYLADRVSLYTKSLFDCEGVLPKAQVVVSAGSDTYYANRVIAKSLGARSVAIMLPKGFRYDFDLIVAQEHDQPPMQDNVVVVPVNLSYPEPQGLVQRIEGKTCVSVIIGGSSRHFNMDVERVEKQLRQIYTLFPDADFVATTSRRTPPDVESLVEQEPFRCKVIASKENMNPIPDFLAISDYVFVTEDSTSMISEAVSFGQSCVEVLPLEKIGVSGKIERLVNFLAKDKCLHFFDGRIGSCSKKVNLKHKLQEAWR